VSPQSWFPGLLAGIGLLAAAASGRGQESPLPVITAPDSVGPAGPAAVPVPTPSWYAGAEVAVLFTAATHYNEHFFAVRGTPAEFLSPRLYLGYDLDGSGSVRFTYRNLTQVDYPDGPIPGWASGQSFTTNWIDLDYVSPEYAPTDWWRVRWEAGGRLVYRHQDWWFQNSYARTGAAENFVAGGPHIGLASVWMLGQSGWVAFGRADSALSFGDRTVTQDYQPLRPDPWGLGMSRSDRASFGASQFDLGLQFGLGRRWQWRGRDIGLAAGIQADVMSFANLHGEFAAVGLVNVGPFVRWEINF
jgi:hypothetical protein